MKTSKIFRCLLTLLVFWGVTVCAVAQETRRVLFGLGTADGKNLVFNTLSGSKPHGVSVRASNFNSGDFYSSVTQTEPGWYVKVGETGTISFENFNYEIKSVGIRRNIGSASLSDTELNVSVSPLSGVKPDNVFDNKVDWAEPECTNISLKKNGTSISLDGIKQIEVSVPSNHGLTINRNTFVREVSIEYVLPEIRIRFANGNKGYDVTVGDNNAQIEGYISGHAGAFVVGSDNVYFKYTSSNSSIAEISSTGRITAKAEGDTQIKATLIQKVGNTEYEIASYDYPLHVFAPFEGLSWNSYDTWYKNSTSNNSSYKFGGEPHVNGIDWTISDKLKSQTTIWENESNTQSSGQYKQFASFEAPAPTTKYWRAAVQKLSCDILVPKYTKVESTMKFGANATLGSESKSDVTYGYELVDLGIKTDANTTFAAASAAATTRIGEITWNTASPAEDASSVSAYRTSDRGNGITYLRNGANEYRKHNILTGLNNGEGYVGDHYTAGAYWKYDNSKNAEPYNETRFFAAMVFLQNQVNYSATVSFGYQDIPTYEYYVYLDYYANYDDNKHLGREDRSVKAKDATIHLNSGTVSFVPNRTGYKLLGWSTDKDAKTAEFPVNGDFYPYDSENGGGKGEVKLYAVWQPNTYTVTLNRAGGSGGTTSVTATFGEPLPSGDDVKAPTRYGYTFGGYFTEQNGAGTMYYDNSMTGVKDWDVAADRTLYAKWTANVCKVELRPNGTGAVAGTPYVMVTHNQKFPEEVDGHAVTPPTRPGYIFNGFYLVIDNTKKYFYDKDMKTLSCVTWPYQADYYVLADWIPTYTVTLDHNDGSGMKEQVAAVYGEAMPAITVPERRGYTFVGYYNGPEDWNQTKYYNADATSARSWDKTSPATIYAHWNMKPYTIIFHSNDSENKTASQEISNQYVGIYTSFERDGYTLTGWSYTPDGDVVFYKDQIIPSGDNHISEPDRVLHLYAQWDLKNMSVTFNYTDPSTKTTISSKNLDGYKLGSSNNSSLSGTIIETPNSDDYVFAGWFDKNENGSMVYDADGNAVEGSSELPGSYYWKKEGNEFVWNSTNDVNLYANWIRDMVSVDVKVIRDDNYENTDYNHRYVGVSVSGLTDIINLSGTNFSGYITVDGVNFLTSDNPNETDNLKSVSLDKAPIWNFRLRNQEIDKSIDEYKDLYTEEPLYDIYTVVNGTTYYLGPKTKEVDGKKDVVESALGVFTSKPDFPFIIYGAGYVCYRPLETKIFNHVLAMIDNNTDWEFENTGRNPQYRPIRIITAGSSISSVSNLNVKKVIKAIKEKLTSSEYAYNVGKADVKITDADLCKGLLYVDMGGAAKVMETTAGELKDFKDKASANCLFFMPGSYTNTGLGNNVVSFNGTSYNSLTNLVIKDKVPFFNPYKFHVGNGVKASYHRDYDYKWNSMCLPFPVKLSSDMKYYKLYGSDNLRLAFVSMSDDVIAANTPVACYGNGTFTLENTGIDVPADVDGEKVYVENVDAISCDDIKDYVENKKGTPASQTWNFKGVRFDTYVYGTKNTGTLPNRAEKSLVYYFANDEFRYVNPEGRVKFAPYRAFLQAPDGLFAKSYRLLVFDEEGTTDITDIVDAAKGDGKIYDLQGRRVKTPLKGHVYVVGGKKRLY